jgi:hypothetical protein
MTLSGHAGLAESNRIAIARPMLASVPNVQQKCSNDSHFNPTLHNPGIMPNLTECACSP